MHKLFVLLLFVASCLPDVFGQGKSSYHFFYFNNKTGVTDTSGKEVLPPMYRCYNNKEELIWVMVQNDSSCVLFNRGSGAQNRYKRTEPYAAKLDDGYYMNVQQDHGPSLLINSKTGKTIELGRAYEGFQRENDYLFATYYLSDSPIKNRKSRRLDVLDMRNKFQPLVTGAYGSIQLLYKAGTVQKDELSRVSFDAVLFSFHQQHQLYDKDMKLVKTFTAQKTGGQDLALASSGILKYKVLPNYQEVPPQPVGPASTLLDGASLPPPPKAKLMSKKTDDHTTLVYLAWKDKEPLPLFTTTANSVYVNTDQINISQVNNQFTKTVEATFDVDLTTGRCLLPQIYWKSFDMKAIQ